jgi:tetratricopeptide (TPR) repeat protein
MRRLMNLGPTAREATCNYLTVYGDKARTAYDRFSFLENSRWRYRIHSVIHLNRQWLELDGRGRLAAGVACGAIRDYRGALYWLEGAPWLPDLGIYELAKAYRSLGRYEEAKKAARKAVDSGWTEINRLTLAWLAWDEAIDGKLGEAQKICELFRPQDIQVGDAVTSTLWIVQSLLEVQNARGADQKKAARRALAQLKSDFRGGSVFRTRREFRQNIWRTVKVLSRHGAGLTTLPWGVRKLSLPL